MDIVQIQVAIAIVVSSIALWAYQNVIVCAGRG
ncbi:MAG: hypothetical protein JWN86_1560 [Planctomycetota bacterium]|nr:hypothetical protein [Planctomycetota bacterium]